MNLFSSFSKSVFTSGMLVICFLLTSFKVNAEWVQLASLNNSRVNAMIKKDNFIFATTDTAGVFRSSDNGLSWQQKNNGMKIRSHLSFTFTDAGIFVSGWGGVYMSTNDGEFWTQIGSGNLEGLVVSLAKNGNDVYAAHGVAGVYKTTNNGGNWVRWALGEGDKMNAILCTGPEFFISIVNTVLRSTDNGKTFNTIVDGLYPNNAEMLCSFENDLYAGTDSGVYYSSNRGLMWNSVRNGMTDLLIRSLANVNSNIFAGTANTGIFLSQNRGAQWTNVSQGLTDMSINYMLQTDQYLLAGSQNGRIWRRPHSEMTTSINLNYIEAASSYELLQNYPNPFNPVTNLEFEIPSAIGGLEFVTLKVYDMRGREVAILINENLKSGSYSLSFDALALPSGVYVYRLMTDEFTMSRKMLLVK